MSNYPKAINKDKVGQYPAYTKSGGGYFYDDVLEFRVWCKPSLGAPDEFEGEVYFYAFPTFEEAKEFSEKTTGSEEPLVLVKQLEWLNEPTEKQFIHEKGERITEWLVDWLKDSKRQPESIKNLIKSNGNAYKLQHWKTNSLVLVVFHCARRKEEY